MEISKKNIRIALFVALGMVLSIIESFIPLGYIFPGLKIGFANIATIVGLRFFGLKELLFIVFLRSFLTSMLSGNFIMFSFSIIGGLLSCTIMYILSRKQNIFSLIGISIAGAFFHNLGQLLVAYFLFAQDFAVFFIAPIILLSSLLTGYIIGYISQHITKELSLSNLILILDK